MTDHAGRPVVLVTGASRGIGRSAALAFARHGLDVALNFSRSESEAQTVAKEVAALGGRAELYQADVADDGAVRAMVERIGSDFGRLDVLVDNAGTTIDTPPS
ncbi:MAG TPA: SDR family NAD(P)-dependent oxidoreductase, partial [Acidimicrobiales bacterium]|nr:SDR family NAD(P)-dependent oxidoreductase [Acidimicrobiales bacterium]